MFFDDGVRRIGEFKIHFELHLFQECAFVCMWGDGEEVSPGFNDIYSLESSKGILNYFIVATPF